MTSLLGLFFLMTASLDQLQPHQQIAGFEAKAVYTDANNNAMGGRFVHRQSGFTLDLLQIQSIPQAYVCVHTFPTSNMGEPHTQEHLLLGKGNVGRAVAAKENMSLVQSTAFTMQLRTCYPFSTSAGVDTFFDHFERSTNALLHPDYTDEEIRREVRNFGVKPKADGTLELEEKGTIYAEMVSSSSQPGYRTYRAMGRLLFGPEHPLSFDSGGDPKYIREMRPEHIRRFHKANYYLGNMEFIASLPNGLSLEETLSRFDASLRRLEKAEEARRAARIEDLPSPRPAAAGAVQIVPFPSKNAQQPGPAQFAWPVGKKFDAFNDGLASFFAEAFASDPSTNLYKLFVDSKTRKLDIGARTVAMSFDNEVYSRFGVYIPDLSAAYATEAKLAEIRAAIQTELARVAAWPDGSPELLEFHHRIEANLLRTRRSLDKLTSSPPGFGGRMSSSLWPGLLRELNEEEGFRKSLVQPALYDSVAKAIGSGKNIWRDKLKEWNLLDGAPYAVAAKAAPELIAREEAEYRERIAAEVLRLKEQYQVKDDQEAIRRYQQDYDAASRELEKLENGMAPARFLDHPPMTLDDQLDYTESQFANGIPIVTGRFPGMRGATAGLALSVKEWSGRQLIYAAALPQLLAASGMTKDGKLLTAEQATERMRREILGLSASYSNNPITGRAELTLVAAGNTPEESLQALGWMEAALYAPNWTLANLPRLRDLVEQSLNALRTTMQRSEETWVNGPAANWVYQTDPLQLSTSSFLARQLHLHRLRWLLTDPANEAEAKELTAFFDRAHDAAQPVTKEALEALAKDLSPGAKKIAADAIRDLLFAASDLPADSRAADWHYLVTTTKADLLLPAAQAIAELDATRQLILKRGNARCFLTVAPGNEAALKTALEKVTQPLRAEAPRPVAEGTTRWIADRVKARRPGKPEPVFVGLLAPNLQGGVFLHSAPFVNLKQHGEGPALDYLASKLFSGGGPHSMFMKTWAAGLAYSNGLRSSAESGRLAYYAERTPELPQTLRFVINELKSAPRNRPLAEYALAQVFGSTRAGGTFEGRTAAMAEDLADRQPPAAIRAFRESILAQRNRPNLDEELYRRMDAIFAKVLPGYPGFEGQAAKLPGASWFVIGSEKQLVPYEQYLKSTEGKDTELVRLYPRDFWVVVE